MMEHYPDMTVTWHGDGTHVDHIVYPGGTASVACTVSIGSVKQHMWLPVMDYRHKAIANPDARSISDAKMRCMVKCFALFGLGKNTPKKVSAPKTHESKPKAAKSKPKAVDPSHDYAYGEELIRAIKATAKVLDKAGWEPDEDFKKRIKAALSRGVVDELVAVKSELDALESPATQLSTPF
jgi:hypothetical protein